MTDTLEIAGLHSRTADRLWPVAENWQLPALPILEDIDWNAVDVVVVSVPTSQNSEVLKSIEPFGSRLTVVIDTPIAWSRRELTACYSTFAKFKQVLVTEDYMNFPPFALLRRAVTDGLIGTLQGITLYNIGFLYHGLALARSFVGFERVRRTWSRGAGAFGKIVGYSFQNGYKAVVVGPYRKHTTGGITIEGSKGILTDFAGDGTFDVAGNRPIYTLASQRSSDRLLTSFSLDGADKKYTIQLPAIRSMAAMNFPDKSDLNLLRSCGLISIFQALDEPTNMNNAYGPSNAVYDSFVSRIAARGLLPVDPFAWFGSDLVGLLRFVSRS
jgi:hypothetical protein